MEDAQIGWIGAVIIGGIAGWLAEIVTRELARAATMARQ